MADSEFDIEGFKIKLGKQIARVRKSKGYSQDRLQLESGIARGTLSKIEAGKSDVRASTLFLIADVLEIQISKLFEFRI